MKKCPYCGRENHDSALHCHECGTPLSDPSVAPKPAEADDQIGYEWLAMSFRYTAGILLAGFIYLLSFGPVHRYCRNRTAVSTCIVKYPLWVGVVYHPAFLISGGTGIYARYLSWWDNLPPE